MLFTAKFKSVFSRVYTDGLLSQRVFAYQSFYSLYLDIDQVYLFKTVLINDSG